MDDQLQAALNSSETKPIPLSLAEVAGQGQPTAVEIQLKPPGLKQVDLKEMVAGANPMLGGGDDKIQELFSGLTHPIGINEASLKSEGRAEATSNAQPPPISLTLFTSLSTSSGGSVLESGNLSQTTPSAENYQAVPSNGAPTSARPKKDRILSADDRGGASETHKCQLCNAVFAKHYQLETHLKAHRLLEQAQGNVGANLVQADPVGTVANESIPQMSKEEKKKRARQNKPGARIVNYYPTEPGEYTRSSVRKPGVIECRECGVTFPNQSRLRAHQKSHTTEKPYKCLHCDAAFTWQTSQKLHMRIHTGEKPYPCQDCDQRFASSSYLKAHIRRVHTKERPYACKFCDQKFSDWGNMRKHQRTHTQEAMHKCEICGESFDWARHLRMHMSTIHANSSTPQQTRAPLPALKPEALPPGVKLELGASSTVPVVLEGSSQEVDPMDPAAVISRVISGAGSSVAASAILTAAAAGAQSTVMQDKLD